MDGKELFLMIEAISNEKNITQEDVIESLEEALAVATKKRNNIDVRVEVDRHSGEFKTFRRWLVIEDGEDFVDDDGEKFDPELHIYQADANGLVVDSYLEEPMESIEFGRIAAQVAKQVIIQKVREAERTVVVENYSNRVGEVVMVTVKRVDRGNVYVDMGGIDGMLSKYDLIPNESITLFKTGPRKLSITLGTELVLEPNGLNVLSYIVSGSVKFVGSLFSPINPLSYITDS